MTYFVFTDLHYDVTQSLSTVYYAKQLGELPGNLTQSWDHRGYAHKLTNYSCYQMAGYFFEASTFWFERAFKFFYAILFGALLAVAAFANRERLSEFRCAWWTVACGLIFCCFSVSSWNACQPEHSAAILAIAATLLLFGRGFYSLAAAAVLASCCFFFKAVTISFAIQPICLAYLCGESLRSSRMKSFVILAVCSFLILLGVTATAALSEITDLVFATRDLNTFDRPWTERVGEGLLGLPLNWLQVAVFPLVTFLGVLSPPERREWLRALPALAVAILPLLVQGRSYAYHQLNYLPLASVAFITLAHRVAPLTQAKILSKKMAGAIGVALLPILIALPLIGRQKFLSHLEFHRPSRLPPAWSETVEQIQEKMRGQNALFASWGDAPYLLQIEPSQKYFSSIAFLGIDQERHLEPGYTREFRDHWLTYDGPLIVAGRELGQLERYPQIQERIWSEYELFHREVFDRYPASRGPDILYFLRRKDSELFAEMGSFFSLE